MAKKTKLSAAERRISELAGEPIEEIRKRHREAHQREEARQAYMNLLYRQDGRHDPSHPLHCRWTGLAVAHRERILSKALDRLAMELQQEVIGELWAAREVPKYAKHFGCHDPAKAV